MFIYNVSEKAADLVSLKFTKIIRYENRTHCLFKVIYRNPYPQVKL